MSVAYLEKKTKKKTPSPVWGDFGHTWSISAPPLLVSQPLSPKADSWPTPGWRQKCWTTSSNKHSVMVENTLQKSLPASAIPDKWEDFISMAEINHFCPRNRETAGQPEAKKSCRARQYHSSCPVSTRKGVCNALKSPVLVRKKRKRYLWS